MARDERLDRLRNSSSLAAQTFTARWLVPVGDGAALAV
jgi:hypothetical protein